jgi:polar amino acid transport system substrate-binding protein
MNIRSFAFIFMTSLWCSLVTAQVCEKVVITGPPAGPPSSWLNDDKLVGASVDFVRDVLLEAGVKTVETKPYHSWAKALDATQAGEVDLIFSAAWSEERSRYLNFIKPSYAGQHLLIIVRKGERFPLRKYADLKGRVGAVGVGEAFGDSKFSSYVKSEPNLVRTSTIAHSFELLLAGKVDYILAYENAANSMIFSNNLGEKVDIVTTYPFYAETFIAVSKRSKCSNFLVTNLSKKIELANQKNLFYLLANKYRAIFYESLPRPQ